MPPKERVVDDWHDRLIEAARVRHTEAVRNNRRNQNAWGQALQELEKSKKKIYIQKGGLNKGAVVGIPDKIPNTIAQVLEKIVREEEPITRPQHEGIADATITDEHVVRRRNYRDSAYAILAALWLEYQGPGQNPQPTYIVKGRAKRFTDIDIDGNFRANTHGAWESKKGLKQKGLILEETLPGNAKQYSLTLAGARACYHIFNEMYHPSKGEYDLVQPRRGTVDRNGIWYPNEGAMEGQRAAATPFQRNSSSSNYYPQPRGVFDGDDDIDEYGRDMEPDLGFGMNPTRIHTPFAPQPTYRTPSYPPPSISSVYEEDPEAKDMIKRRRLLKLDPGCADKVRELMQEIGCSEHEAWLLYEQGAADRTVKSIVATADKDDDFQRAIRLSEQETRKMTSSKGSRPIMSVRKMDEDNDEEDIAVALELSKKLTRIPSNSEYTDEFGDSQAQLDHAIALSLAEESRKSTVNPGVSSSNSNNRSSSTPAVASSRPISIKEPISLIEADSQYQHSSRDNTPNPPSSNATQRGSVSKKRARSAGSSSTTIAIDLTDDEAVVTPIDLEQHSHKRMKVLPIILEDSFQEDYRLEESTPISSTKKKDVVESSSIIDLVDEREEDTQTIPTESMPFPGRKQVEYLSMDSDASDEEGDEAEVAECVPPPLPKLGSGNIVEICHHEYIYTTNEVSAQDIVSEFSMVLYVESRERKTNLKYRELYQDFVSKISRYAPRSFGISCEEKSLHIGDLALVYQSNHAGKGKGGGDETYFAGLLIERKTLSDIITRSTDSDEAPHCKQERYLRYSGAEYAYMLIEGEWHNIHNFAPRTSRDTELQKADVIGSKEELLSYMMAVVARNVGKQQVKVIHTINATETALIVTAIAVVIRYQDMKKAKQIASSIAIGSSSSSSRDREERSRRLYDFQSLLSYWTPHKRNKRLAAFQDFLKEQKVSADMLRRVGRRFGDLVSLRVVYYPISRSLIATRLLSDLSLGGGNFDHMSKEMQGIGTESMCKESEQIYNAAMGIFTSASMEAVLKPVRVVKIICNEGMKGMMEGFKDFQVSLIHHVVQEQGGSTMADAWCIMDAVDHCSPRYFRRSSRLYLAVLSGSVVIENLLLAYSKVVTRLRETEQLEVQLVEVAWQNIKAGSLSRHMLDHYGRDVGNREHPQLIILLEGLGRGGLIGACGRLKKANTASIHHSNDSSASAETMISICLVDNEGEIRVSRKAAGYLCSKLEYLVCLFSAYAYIAEKWQCMHVHSQTEASLSAKQVTAKAILEMQRIALLSYDKQT